MSDEQRKVSNKIYSIVSGLIADIQDCGTEDAGTIARHTTRDIIDVVLASGLNEVAKPKPAIKYYIEFYALGGVSEYKKETTHKNYKDGDLIKYNNFVWEVKFTITCEDEGRTSVIFGAYQTREN